MRFIQIIILFLSFSVIILSQSIEEKYKNAIAYLSLGDYQKAINLLTSISLSKTNDPDFYYVLSYAYFKLGKNDRALENVTKALSINSQSEKFNNFYGVILSTAKNFSEAEKVFESVLLKNPQNVDAKINLANVKKRNGKVKEAENMFKEILTERENSFEANYNYGLLLFEKGDYYAASRFFAKSAELQENESALLYAAEAFYRVNKHAEAGEYFSKYLLFKEMYSKTARRQIIEKEDLISPADSRQADPAIYTSLGQKITQAEESFQSGDYVEALRFYLLASKEDARNYLLQYNVGVCFFYLGRYMEAAKYFHNSYKLKPEFVETIYNLALSYFYQKYYAEAQRYFAIAFKLDSLDSDIIYHYALSIYKIDNKSFEIIRLLNLLPEKSPYALKGRLLIANVYANNGDYLSAKRSLEKILELAPYNLEANYNLAVILKRLNDEYGSKEKFKLSADIGKNMIEKK